MEYRQEKTWSIEGVSILTSIDTGANTGMETITTMNGFSLDAGLVNCVRAVFKQDVVDNVTFVYIVIEQHDVFE